MKALSLLLILILHYMTVSFCPLNCSRNLLYLCISKSLSTPSLERILHDEIKSRFSVCHFDPETSMSFKVNLDSSASPLELDRPTIVVALLECEDDLYENIQPSRKAWNINNHCQNDFFLLLLLRNNTVQPHLYEMSSMRIKTPRNFNLPLSRQYNISSLHALFEELFAGMSIESTNLSLDQEYQPPDQKQHWPTWAIVLVIVCVLLTVFAFLLGNCITKRSTPLRFKGPTNNNVNSRPENRRLWGAGFSGGMWAAA